eukprot:scaffold32529_cov129-Isochrysis_galbana.AAC.1
MFSGRIRYTGTPTTQRCFPSSPSHAASVRRPSRLGVGEIVIVPSALNTSDRQKMEGYLAHKWGLEANLPADHPHKSAAP